MRPAVCPKKIACWYSAPPAMPAGIAQSNAPPAPSSTPANSVAYHVLQRRFSRGVAHHGAASAAGNTCSRITGPFARIPSAMPIARYASPRRRSCSTACTTPSSESSAPHASSVSNISSEPNDAHSNPPTVISGAQPRARASCGHSDRASAATSDTAAMPASGPTSRAETVLTPNTFQPSITSQNSSGGL